ncbi:MAG: outer membrane beta-barrel protein [Acidobacteriota bacterium]|nr:outer membrane beta-barrel protein [Acidobacteriota bacterium]
MIRNGLVMVLVFVWLGPGLSAQSPPTQSENKWEVSPFVGFGGAGDDTFATPVEEGASQNVGLDVDQSFVLGIRITENRGRYLGAEFEYSFTNQPLFFRDLSPTLPSLALDHTVHKFAYNLLVYGRERPARIRPFGSIGFGTSFFHVSNDSQDEALRQGVNLKNRWKLALSYGGGIKFRMAPRWGFRVDFRDQVTGVPDFGFPSQAPLLEGGETGPGFRAEGLLHNWQTTFGFVYHLR